MALNSFDFDQSDMASLNVYRLRRMPIIKIQHRVPICISYDYQSVLYDADNDLWPDMRFIFHMQLFLISYSI